MDALGGRGSPADIVRLACPFRRCGGEVLLCALRKDAPPAIGGVELEARVRDRRRTPFAILLQASIEKTVSPAVSWTGARNDRVRHGERQLLLPRHTLLKSALGARFIVGVC
jgi:hypothetical protein